MSRGAASMATSTFSVESTEDSKPKKRCFPCKSGNKQNRRSTTASRPPPPETNVGSIRGLGRRESAASMASGPADLSSAGTGVYANKGYNHTTDGYPTGGNRNMGLTSQGSGATTGHTSVADMTRALQRLTAEVRVGRGELAILLNKYLCQVKRNPPCPPPPPCSPPLCRIGSAAPACRLGTFKVRASENEGRADIQPLFRIMLGGGGTNQSGQSRQKSTTAEEAAASMHKNGSASGNFVEELSRSLQMLLQQVQNDKVALNVMVQRTPSSSCPISPLAARKSPRCQMLEQLEGVSQELECLTKQVQDSGTELTCLLRQALSPCAQPACPLPPKPCCSQPVCPLPRHPSCPLPCCRASELPPDCEPKCPRPCCRPALPDPNCELEMIGQVVEQLGCEIRAENEALTCLLKQAIEATACCEPQRSPSCGPTEAELCELQYSLRQLVTEVQAEQQQLTSMIREALGLSPACSDESPAPAPTGPSCAMLSNLQQLQDSLQMISEEVGRRDDGRNAGTVKTLKAVEESIAQLSRELMEPPPCPSDSDTNSMLMREIAKLITEATGGGTKSRKSFASASCGTESVSDVLGAVCKIRQCLERMSGSTKDKSEEEDEEGEGGGGRKQSGRKSEKSEKGGGSKGGGGRGGGGGGGTDTSKEIQLTLQFLGLPD